MVPNALSADQTMRVVTSVAGCTLGPSSLTLFSTFISRNIGKAQFFRQIGSCLAEFLQVWSYLSPGIFGENRWKSSIEIGVEQQSYRERGCDRPSTSLCVLSPAGHIDAPWGGKRKEKFATKVRPANPALLLYALL